MIVRLIATIGIVALSIGCDQQPQQNQRQTAAPQGAGQVTPVTQVPQQPVIVPPAQPPQPVVNPN